jgi:hypothetical protein
LGPAGYILKIGHGTEQETALMSKKPSNAAACRPTFALSIQERDRLAFMPAHPARGRLLVVADA